MIIFTSSYLDTAMKMKTHPQVETHPYYLWLMTACFFAGQFSVGAPPTPLAVWMSKFDIPWDIDDMM
jgi:hypothetical protein